MSDELSDEGLERIAVYYRNGNPGPIIMDGQACVSETHAQIMRAQILQLIEEVQNTRTKPSRHQLAPVERRIWDAVCNDYRERLRSARRGRGEARTQLVIVQTSLDLSVDKIAELELQLEEARCPSHT